MQSKYLLLVTAIAAITSLSSPALAAPNGADQKLVSGAAEGGMAEVKMATLAAGKTKDAQVKGFAQKMLTDHGAANNELKGLATKDGFSLPSALSAKHQAAYDQLLKLNGKDFDKAYLAGQVADHEDALKLFDKGSKTAVTPNLKAFFSKTDPVIKMHLDMVRSMSKPSV